MIVCDAIGLRGAKHLHASRRTAHRMVVAALIESALRPLIASRPAKYHPTLR